MVDNILEEIRLCDKCGTKTFCDYCPKCGGKMPDSRSMHKRVFGRTDFDQYLTKQAKQHNTPLRTMDRKEMTKQPLKQTRITAQPEGNNIIKVIAYIIIVIIIVMLVFLPRGFGFN